MYDCIIIGTGPAGLSAALNLKTYKKSFVWFGSKNLSDKVQKAEKITNYPGFPELTGQELFSHFTDHIQSAGLDITEKTVTNVMSVGTYYMVLADNEVYEAKTLILAMGVMTAKLLKGEDELLGRGVSYCATCDGMFYKDKEIAVLCNDPKYEHEVEYLADLAAKVTYFPMFSDSQIKKENVTISKDFPLEIKGSDRVTGIAPVPVGSRQRKWTLREANRLSAVSLSLTAASAMRSSGRELPCQWGFTVSAAPSAAVV